MLFLTFILINFLVQTLQCFIFFHQKLVRNTLYFSSSLPWAAQTAQTEELMFQLVTYRPNVYKTGFFTHPKSKFPQLQFLFFCVVKKDDFWNQKKI